MLADLKVKEFCDQTASSEPVPGGGSAAALSGALAAGLTQMVAGLTIGHQGIMLVASRYGQPAPVHRVAGMKLIREQNRPLVNPIDADDVQISRFGNPQGDFQGITGFITALIQFDPDGLITFMDQRFHFLTDESAARPR